AAGIPASSTHRSSQTDHETWPPYSDSGGREGAGSARETGPRLAAPTRAPPSSSAARSVRAAAGPAPAGTGWSGSKAEISTPEPPAPTLRLAAGYRRPPLRALDPDC